MNMKKTLLFLLTTLLLGSCAAPAADTETDQPIDTAAVVLRVIANRKSVRHFTAEPVTAEQLETLARAAMAAPTARNQQPWAVMAVTDRVKLDSLAAALPFAKMLSQAPAALLVCGDMQRTLEGHGAQFWIQDCSAATENLLLAAEAMGLGAVWTAAYPDEERMESVSRVLGLPDYIIPLNVIPVGHPTGEDMPKDKWKAENYHLNKW